MVDEWPRGSLELKAEGIRRSAPLRAWEGLELPPLRPGEILLLPPPRLKPLPHLTAGTPIQVSVPFEVLLLRGGPEGVHPTVQ